MRRLYFIILLTYFQGVVFSQEPGSGYSLSLNGIDNRIVYGNIYEDLVLPVTFTGWIYLPEVVTTTRKVLFASSWPESDIYSGIWYSLGPESMAVSYGDGFGTNNPQFRRSAVANFKGDYSGSWLHVAFVCSGATDMRLFINGAELSLNYSGTSNFLMSNISSGRCIIGHNTSNNYLDGTIDKFELWNYALAVDEIRQNMCKELDQESGLMGRWDFNEGAGSNVKEQISDESGNIEGAVDWQLSGAPIGDESYFEYFDKGTKMKLFKNQSDSFWITTESNNWIGYHVYKVNQPPNSMDGSTLNFANGYYGVFPVFDGGYAEEYSIYAGSYCGELEFRNGNDDSSWEAGDLVNDSMRYYTTTGISELIYLDAVVPEPLNSYTICEGENVEINAESECVSNYLWSTGNVSAQVVIDVAGNYWLERETPIGVIRDDFTVELIEQPIDLINRETYTICESDFPLELNSEVENNIIWNNGSISSSILIEEPGIYWVEYQSACGIVRDSVIVELNLKDEYFIPNVLTPNEDGKNDCLMIDSHLLGSNLKIFNRAGVNIYQSELYNNDWCPDIPPGVYFYIITNNCNLEVYKGWISVLD